jgi:hypothetical protein
MLSVAGGLWDSVAAFLNSFSTRTNSFGKMPALASSLISIEMKRLSSDAMSRLSSNFGHLSFHPSI